MALARACSALHIKAIVAATIAFKSLRAVIVIFLDPHLTLVQTDSRVDN
jgi:hypothetical protein